MPEAPAKLVFMKYRTGTSTWTNVPKRESSFILVDEGEVRRGLMTSVIDQLQQVADRWLETHSGHTAVHVECPIFADLGLPGRELRGKLQVFSAR